MNNSDAMQSVAISPPLEYAPQSAVGDLTLSRVDGVTTITIRPGWRRILRVGWIFVATLVYWAIIYPALRFFASSLTGLPTVAWNGPAIAIGVGLAISASAFFKVVVFTLYGFRWTVSVDTIQFTGRRFNEIVRQHYPRSIIGYLKVKRLRLKNQTFKRPYLAIIKPDGNNVAILSGTRAELEFACQAFTEALGLPNDPFGESAYPTAPRRSRTKSRIMANGSAISLHPPLLGYEGWAIVSASLLLPPTAIELLHRNLPLFIDVSAFSIWGAVASFGFAVIMAAIMLRVRSQLRRVINLAWVDGTLHLTERSVFKPCAESWPVPDPQWLRMEREPLSKFARLWLITPDGSHIQLIDKGRARDVTFIHGMLTTAIARHQKPA